MLLVYKRAAEALDQLSDRRGSLKYIIFNRKYSDTLTFRKRVYAVAIETLKKKVPLQKLIESTNLLHLEPQLNRNLAMILLHDYLYGRGIQCGGPLKYSILKHKKSLQLAFKSLDTTDTIHIGPLPKYGRVNLIKSDMETVITTLEREGYTLRENDEVGGGGGGGGRGEGEFSVDPDVPGLLKFHHRSSLTDNVLCVNYHLILQDKASCLPAHLLSPPPSSRVVDCCAAPGNKTIQLANIMNNDGSIIAYDKDPQRFQVLQKRLTAAGVTCAQPILSDILKVSELDAEYILLDPSCSGSGITQRIDYHSEEKSWKRLMKLSSFQLKVLKHVLSFPSVKRVVYSTCSTHKEENEMVVDKALQLYGNEFELQNLMPEWSCRGLPIISGGERCLRLGPDNGTNGFFIAMIVRKHPKTYSSSFSSSSSSPDLVSSSSSSSSSPLVSHSSSKPINDHSSNSEGRRKRRRQRQRKRTLPVTTTT